VQQTTVHESGCKKLKNTEILYSDRHKMEGPKEIQFLKDNKLYHNTQAGRNILLRLLYFQVNNNAHSCSHKNSSCICQ